MSEYPSTGASNKCWPHFDALAVCTCAPTATVALPPAKSRWLRVPHSDDCGLCGTPGGFRASTQDLGTPILDAQLLDAGGTTGPAYVHCLQSPRGTELVVAGMCRVSAPSGKLAELYRTGEIVSCNIQWANVVACVAKKSNTRYGETLQVSHDPAPRLAKQRRLVEKGGILNTRRRLPDGTSRPNAFASAWPAEALTAGTLGACRQITPKPPPLWTVRTPEEAAEHWAASIGPNATPPVADSAPGISPVYGSWLYRKSTPKS
jgi:hypothetical protein